MAHKPRGDATPVKQYGKGKGKRLGPFPYGPVQHNSGSKLQQAKHLPGQRKGYNA